MCLAVPGRIVEVEESAGLRMGQVDFGGVRKQVCLAYVPEATTGDYVIVHVGFALSRLDELEAERTLELLRQAAALERRSRTAEPVRYVSEFRDPALARRLLDQIRAVARRPWTVMEVCGGQTHTIVRQGIDEQLPRGLRMIHGPGCPVCVTSLEQIDRALAIAARPGVIFASYGDMLRVPGSSTDLLSLRASGADVRPVYSPLDAVRLAASNSEREVVFFAIGFETTAPANAMAVLQAEALGLGNFSMVVSHVLVPPALVAILERPGCEVQGFLAPGHVCTVMGAAEYERIAARYRVPIVIAGFEPLDLLEGILMLVRQLETGRCEVENQYARAVRLDGNAHALAAVRRVFRIVDRGWRGIGTIPASGLRLAGAFERFDAEARFEVHGLRAAEHPACVAGEILQGVKQPTDCPAYGTRCTPRRPLGAPMVSSEGTCAAFYAAGRGLDGGASAAARAPARAAGTAAPDATTAGGGTTVPGAATASGGAGR